jgi:Holliday junction resolvasome RuvABC DNA-binding subunit
VNAEPSSLNRDAFSALLGLGYARQEVEETLSALSSDAKETDTLIREALRLLGKRS